MRKSRRLCVGANRTRVQLVSPHPFEALQLDLPPVADARTLTLSPPKTDEIHNYGLKGYVYETKLALFPKQSGVLTIPSIAVAGAIAVGSGQSESFAETNPEVRVTVKPIDLRYDAPWWLVAEAITMTEVWTPAPEELRVGNTVRRQIAVTVTGATAEHLPEIEQPTLDGYSVVGSETTTKRINTQWRNRHGTPILGPARSRRRRDFNRTHSSRNWDPAAGDGTPTCRQNRLNPTRDVTARRAQLINNAMAAHRNRRIGLFTALSIPASVLLILMAATLYKSVPTRADRRLSRACKRHSTPAACFRAVTGWSRESFGIDSRSTIGHLQTTFGGEAAERLETLQRTLFSPADTATEPVQLVRSLVHAARRRRVRRFWKQIIQGINRQIDPRQRHA